MLDFRWSAESSPLSLICSFSTFGSVSRFLLVWVDHSAPCLVGYHPPKRRSLRKTETYLPVGRDVSSSEDESFNPPSSPGIRLGAVVYLSPTLGGGGGRPGWSAFRILYSSLALLPLFFPARRVWHSRSRRFCPQPHSIHRSRSASKAPGSLGVAGGAPPPSSSGETSANQASCNVRGAS